MTEQEPRLTSTPLPRHNVLGVGVSIINLDIAAATIRDWIRRREQHWVCITGVHGVMESQRDDELRRIHNRAGMVTPDGMPLVFLLRRAGHRHVSRVYGPDLMLRVCEEGIAAGTRHYLYGASDEVLGLLHGNLERRFPGIVIAGAYSPPFRALTDDEDRQIIERVNAARPDIVWVGLSTPKQERWMASHAGRISASVMVGVGAAFDFHAGVKRQAPRWMQRGGLEWLFRLITEPRRLWKRYLRNNPAFIGLVLAQRFGLRRFRLDDSPSSAGD